MSLLFLLVCALSDLWGHAARVFLSSVISHCSFVASRSWLLCHTRGWLLQPVTCWWSRGEALVYPWSWRFQLRVSHWGTRFDLTWPDLTGVGLGQNGFIGHGFCPDSAVRGTRHKQSSVLAVWYWQFWKKTLHSLCWLEAGQISF